MDTDEQDIDLEVITADLREFLRGFQTLQLATASRTGVAEASYAPFYRSGRDFFIYVSELSAHTRNLGENRNVGVLLIEGEDEAKHPFARRRIAYRCTADEIPRGSQRFEATMDAMQERFGSFIGMLRKLGDFHLFRLVPGEGTYVAGFARTFRLVGECLDEVEAVTEADVKKGLADGDGPGDRENSR